VDLPRVARHVCGDPVRASGDASLHAAQDVGPPPAAPPRA
jgi:hypothetical protein